MTVFRDFSIWVCLCAALTAPSHAAEANDNMAHDAEMHKDHAMDGPGGQVLAKVGDAKITLGHVIAMVQVLPPEQMQQPMDVVFADVLERLIQQEAIAQTLHHPSRLVQLQMENERRSLLASVRVQEIADGIEIDTETLMATYDEQFIDSSLAAEFNASHILVETKEEAMMIAEMLKEGADFATLAREKSIGPSGANGGELGWFGPGRMVKPIEESVMGLDIGSFSGPVQTEYGWHVIKLNDSRIPGVPTFEDVKSELERDAWNGAFREVLADVIGSVPIQRMDISEINPEVLMKPEMLQE